MKDLHEIVTSFMLSVESKTSLVPEKIIVGERLFNLFIEEYLDKKLYTIKYKQTPDFPVVSTIDLNTPAGMVSIEENDQ